MGVLDHQSPGIEWKTCHRVMLHWSVRSCEQNSEPLAWHWTRQDNVGGGQGFGWQQKATGGAGGASS